MAVASPTLDLKGLKHAAESTPALWPYVQRFEMIRNAIGEHCSDAVVWAAAYGSFIDLVGSGQSKRSRRREKVLVVTTLSSLYDAIELLADNVFADVLITTGHLTDYRVWTLAEYRAVSSSNRELMREVLESGVTLYGEPPGNSAHTDRAV